MFEFKDAKTGSEAIGRGHRPQFTGIPISF